MNDNRKNDLEIENHIELAITQNIDNVNFTLEINNPTSFRNEVIASFFLMKGTKLNVLLIFAPIAILGTKTGILGEFSCFCFAGLALIPCAERLSFVTEHVAEHTNETIGALLNATFGNAPELLISGAALRNGFYRVVQLTLLGSVLTNLLFVFGISCFIGGLQWQTQELRITSGNVSIGMLLAATMGIVLPAVLKLANESVSSSKTDTDIDTNGDNTLGINVSDIAFSRLNSILMVVGYCCYLIFQLGSHKEEFDYDGDEYAVFGGGHNIVRTPQFQNKKMTKHPVRRNLFCKKYCIFMKYCPDVESRDVCGTNFKEDEGPEYEHISTEITPQSQDSHEGGACIMRKGSSRYFENNKDDHLSTEPIEYGHLSNIDTTPNTKSKLSDIAEEDEEFEPQEEMITLRCGLFWLAMVTAAISLISGVIVDTIDGFALRSNMSEVFTSVIIVPYFSNIAEQVSAVIFAYRNKMDLCIGVSVGSAIQIAQLVMPLTCLSAWVMGRSMTLYFRAYETICLFLGVICVASVLQGGTTNWLVGVFLVSVYLMMAIGFFFHENENISVDEEQRTF